MSEGLTPSRAWAGVSRAPHSSPAGRPVGGGWARAEQGSWGRGRDHRQGAYHGGEGATGCRAPELPASSLLLPDLTLGSQTPGRPNPPAPGTLTWSRAGRPGRCPGRSVLVGTGHSLQKSQQALPICRPWGTQTLTPQGLPQPLSAYMPSTGHDLGGPQPLSWPDLLGGEGTRPRLGSGC